MLEMKSTINAVEIEGALVGVKIIIGIAAVTEQFTSKVGSD